jgi:hypothetical protein
MSIDITVLEREGYVLARDVCQTDLIDIVQELGPIRVDPRSPDRVRDIRPQPIHSAKENTLSSRYGIGAFPFHTDTAHWEELARYLALYCMDPGEGRRPTLLQDSRAWQFDDDEKELACRALWKTGHVRPRLCTFAKCTDRQLAVRYDKDCMRPMTAEARKLEALINFRMDCTVQQQIDWEPECLLIIDNKRMVHARGKSNRADTNRVLKRILIGGA